MSTPEHQPLTLADLFASARRTAGALGETPVAQEALALARRMAGSDPEAWDALATAVDEIVEVVLFQQRLFEQAFGVGTDADLRWSDLVEQARRSRSTPPDELV